ncbi:MAG: LEA type 2 family protein [Xanthomonadales bacterium]|nr:LEA type 2 family protein [Xanthomonadales bacterium]
MNERPPRHVARLGMALLALALFACGGTRVPDLEAPKVRIIEITSGADQGTARLRLDNPVRAPMPAAGVEFELRIQDQSLGRFTPPFALTVPALGSETVTVRFAKGAAPAALTEPDSGRLSYALEGEVRLENGSRLDFLQEGWITPTPGKPGSWR